MTTEGEKPKTQTTILALRLALQSALDESSFPPNLIKNIFAQNFFVEGFPVDTFLKLVPIGLSSEALKYFGLDGKYNDSDIFWGTPDDNPNLPNVYLEIYDNCGNRVTAIAGGRRLQIPNFSETDRIRDN